MTYSESAKGKVISKARAEHEICNVHGHCYEDFELFLTDMGDHETYDAYEVLVWLGY
jgi:hypothetical protein